MCGITAIAGKKINPKQYKTEAMLQLLKHRGPDGRGEIFFPNCWMGHRRLSIIDIDKGQQPMTDKNFTIVFNGEIYNYVELQSQLKKEGCKFKTNSDTEVILKAYQKWGHECPKYIDGMFAFAIWDNKKNELFIARDRLGKKPLYYFFDKNNILIASEIKALIASGTLKPEIDYKAIDNYLRVMYIPPWKSVYKNIHQLPPSHCGVFKNGKISLKKYWQINNSPIKISYHEAKEELIRLINEAVKKRLTTSDVEIGTFLSGGIDSSLITLVAAQESKNKLKVFSINYSGHEEYPFAKQVCQKIKAEHHIQQVEAFVPSELEKVISYIDEPHADTADFPHHLLSQLATKKVKTVLSGDGADEIFFGYKWHTQNKKNTDIFDHRINSICVFDEEQRVALWQSKKYINDDIIAKKNYKKNYTSMDKVAMFDLSSHLPGQILARADRASMMHGLELRSPFLDTNLIEFVFNLPIEYKIHKGEQKYIIKDILNQYMPKSFVYRKKQGFGAPIDGWLENNKNKEYIYTKLGYKSKIRNILSGAAIDQYLNNFYIQNKKDKRAGQRIWVLLCLEIWLNSQVRSTYEK